MKQTWTRQPYLDSLRGVAALIVVIHHYLLLFYPYTVYGKQAGYTQHFRFENIFFYPPFGLINAGRFAICLFFILSGYVLSFNNLGVPGRTANILASIVKRPIRLGGIVIFSIICGAALWYWGLFANNLVATITTSKWFGHCWSHKFDFHRLFFILRTSMFSRGMVYNPPLWTIKIELYGSMLVFVYTLLFGRFKYRLLVAVFLIILLRDSLYQGFVIGLCLADLKKNYNIQKFTARAWATKFHWLIIVVFVYLSSYPAFVNKEFLQKTVYTYLPDSKYLGTSYPMLSALLVFILVLSSGWAKKILNNKIFLYIGTISYAIYAMHFLIIGSLSSWLFLALQDPIGYIPAFLVVFLSTIPVIIITAHFVTMYIDKPSIKLAYFVGKKVIKSL